jgi:transmembrane sensor
VSGSTTRRDLRPIPTTADEWFARRRAPDRTPEEEAAFRAWLAADPSNAAQYRECESFWRIPQGLRTEPDLAAAALGAAGLSSTPAPQRTAKWAAAIALAAGLAAIAWFVVPMYMANPGAIQTARGEQRAVTLSDGSMVQLNTDSLFVEHMSERERRVELLRGEAFFDVVRDSARPFVVKVGASEVRVVGTQFSVREHAGKLEVVVKEGIVNVIPDASRAVAESDKVELIPGNRLNYDNTQRLVKVAVVDPDRTLLWRKGMIELDRTPLEEAVEEVNRYSVIPIAIEDARLAAIRVSGGFRVGDTEAFLYALKERFDVSIDRRAERISLR